ncbi:MAG: hypothetical protein RLZZ196_3350 [Bacteroidota bacterium]|jgi:hypothetical protein
MSYIKALMFNWKEKVFIGFLSLFGLFLGLALLTQISFVVLQFTGHEDITTKIANEFSWKFDGTFKNSPGNIWYNAEEHLWVDGVENQVKIGKLAGNRNLAFGVKNILEEYVQEKGYDLSKDAPYHLKVNIVYLDVLTTKTNISVFHKGEEEVVVRLQGILYKDGKKEKEVVVEESSSEISMSTLIVDEGGNFNQTSLSNALKKASDKLITKLLGNK